MITVGLIGATNAGKSTLFNWLIGTYRAIVTDIEGTTQDILRHEFEINGQKVTLLDTPGLHDFSDELEMIGRVIAQSDVLVFVVNHQVGWTHKDTDIATMIRKVGGEDKTILLVNKVDRAHNDTNTMLIKADYYQYGFENVILTSTMHGRGLDELQDGLDDFITFNDNEINAGIKLNLAIVGKPNTGKSTLMNTLCKGQISKVSDQPGTTLDYLTHEFKWGEDVYTLYDTSGIRRKGRARGLEKIANDKTFSMLEYIKPMVIFTMDASEPVSQTDLALFNRLIDLHLPLVVALTKIDKISKEELDRLIKGFNVSLYQSKRVDYVGISSFTKAGLGPLMKKVRAIHERAQNRVSTARLNKILTTAWVTNPPNFPKNRVCKIYYGTQTDVNPPTFNLFINNNDKVTNSFTRWIENVLRQHLDMQGLPIKIYYKGKIRGED